MTFIQTPECACSGWALLAGGSSQWPCLSIWYFTHYARWRKLADATITEQTEQILANLDAILQAAGSSRRNVVKVTVFVSDIHAWGTVNQLYTQFFGEHRPARSIVPVGPLHYGLSLELEAIAVVE
jgi:2-iminobutanoate/2-iminopropanoate deaminase